MFSRTKVIPITTDLPPPPPPPQLPLPAPQETSTEFYPIIDKKLISDLHLFTFQTPIVFIKN